MSVFLRPLDCFTTKIAGKHLMIANDDKVETRPPPTMVMVNVPLHSGQSFTKNDLFVDVFSLLATLIFSACTLLFLLPTNQLYSGKQPHLRHLPRNNHPALMLLFFVLSNTTSLELPIYSLLIVGISEQIYGMSSTRAKSIHWPTNPDKIHGQCYPVFLTRLFSVNSGSF
jgi:hypothetical protein